MKKRDEARPTSRWVLIMAAATAIASLACLAAILVSYAAGGPAWPALYWIGLYGLPLAFALMVLGLILNLRDRRRR
ncbi:hypothetical protein [Zhihengliuella halotolerans]|uniref:Uncharacterized protein UPF0233 n=1 Tax=Zhihengliuella halotolerans TaxID=370736 RepID=A0A4Q8AAS6_9MICC|nr:hypothetical protein [Zhihengliuella halotolerans]RZU60599.1 uncharacterized protein UPF0233 [Zhihengliuella halotolerans]